MDGIDLILFVEEVQNRPILWDMLSENYNDRIAKKRAWEEICRIFYNDFDEKSNAEKNGLCFTLSTKWRNLRDNYRRALKKGQKSNYLHSKILHFLDDLLLKNCQVKLNNSLTQDDINIHSEFDEEGAKRMKFTDEEHDTVYEVGEYYEVKPDLESLAAAAIIDDVRTQDEALSSRTSKDTIDRSSPPIEDDDMAFFKSMLPMIRNMTSKKKIAFRIGVMNLLQKHTEM